MYNRILPMQPLSRVNLSEQATTQLVAMMAERGLTPGDLLPNEGELCRLLGVGRSTVREAIRSLAFLGVVQAKPGVGTTFMGDTERMLDGLLLGGLLRSRQDIEDLCESRLVLETQTARLAARRAQPADLERLEQLRAQMEDASLSRAEFVQLDLDFHLAIALAAKNRFLTQLLRATRGLMQEWIVRSQQLGAARPLAWTGHAAILDAIASQRSDEASQLMADHLNGSFELLRESMRTAGS